MSVQTSRPAFTHPLYSEDPRNHRRDRFYLVRNVWAVIGIGCIAFYLSTTYSTDLRPRNYWQFFDQTETLLLGLTATLSALAGVTFPLVGRFVGGTRRGAILLGAAVVALIPSLWFQLDAILSPSQDLAMFATTRSPSGSPQVVAVLVVCALMLALPLSLGLNNVVASYPGAARTRFAAAGSAVLSIAGIGGAVYLACRFIPAGELPAWRRLLWPYPGEHMELNLAHDAGLLGYLLLAIAMLVVVINTLPGRGNAHRARLAQGLCVAGGPILIVAMALLAHLAIGMMWAERETGMAFYWQLRHLVWIHLPIALLAMALSDLLKNRLFDDERVLYHLAEEPHAADPGHDLDVEDERSFDEAEHQHADAGG
ncbi:MAG: hypothetical protein ACOCYN_04130 [Planctomycetota bacterium]